MFVNDGFSLEGKVDEMRSKGSSTPTAGRIAIVHDGNTGYDGKIIVAFIVGQNDSWTEVYITPEQRDEFVKALLNLPMPLDG